MIMKIDASDFKPIDDALEADINRIRFIGACRVGDLHAIKRLVQVVGVSAESSLGDFFHSRNGLHEAAASRQTDACVLLLKLGAKVDNSNRGDTALMAAVINDDHATAEALIVNTNKETGQFSGIPEMFEAAKLGNGAMCVRLISHGVNPNAIDEYDKSFGRTALWRCAEKNAVGAMEDLVKAGADINVMDGNGSKPIHAAAMHGGTEACLELIRLGASADYANLAGATPIFTACNYVRWNTAIALAAHTSPQYIDMPNADNGLFPLYLAARQGVPDLTDALIAAGANVNQQTISGESAFMVALKSLHNGEAWDRHAHAILESLLNAGADINAVNNEGQSALWCACDSQNIDVVLWLLDRGANINLGDRSGTTPVVHAATMKRQDICALLAERGADIKKLLSRKTVTEEFKGIARSASLRGVMDRESPVASNKAGRAAL